MIETLTEILVFLVRLAFVGLILGIAGAFILALLIIGYLIYSNKRWE